MARTIVFATRAVGFGSRSDFDVSRSPDLWNRCGHFLYYFIWFRERHWKPACWYLLHAVKIDPFMTKLVLAFLESHPRRSACEWIAMHRSVCRVYRRFLVRFEINSPYRLPVMDALTKLAEMGNPAESPQAHQRSRIELSYETGLAQTRAAKEGDLGEVEQYLAGGGDPKVRDGILDTPLLAASGRGHRRVVRRLLSAGADVNVKDVFGRTPLIRAAERGHGGVLTDLIRAGADIDAEEDRYGMSALVVASGADHRSCVRELIGASADVDRICALGLPALSYASSHGNLSVVKALIAAGADIEKPDSHGRTPLMWAAHGENLSFVKVLIHSGADLKAVTDGGESALDFAVDYDTRELLRNTREADEPPS